MEDLAQTHETDSELDLALDEPTPKTDIESSNIDTETTTENVETKTAPVSPYDAENDELDNIIQEATKTQEDVRQEEKARLSQQARKIGEISPEKAAEMATKGLVQAVGMLREETGRDIRVTQSALWIGSVSLVPAIMKYGPIVQQYIEDAASGVDADSNMPEYIAAGGLTAFGAMTFLKNRKAPKINVEGTADGH